MTNNMSKDLLNQSYRYCREVARKRAKNFYYSFLVLPREKRDAMCAVYAFMRYCDDIADDPGVKSNREGMLQQWRESLDSAMQGDCDGSLILPAFQDTVDKFSIPTEYFHQLIDGATMDLSVDKYHTFQQLYDYCYKVASVVGLVCIHIFGFDSPDAKKYAEYCGIAFQLTNILRDLKEDAEMGRVYLPEEDLQAFGYTGDDLAHEVRDDRFYKLMEFEVKRARDYYNAALPLIPLVHGSGKPGLCAMIGIYSRILDKIENQHYDVFESRISLSKKEKVSIAAKTLLKTGLNGGQSYLSMLQL